MQQKTSDPEENPIFNNQILKMTLNSHEQMLKTEIAGIFRLFFTLVESLKE